MIEWGLERARQAALERYNKALGEEDFGAAGTASGQIIALRGIGRAAKRILQEVGVPDIPLSTEQEEPVLPEVSPSPSPPPTPLEIIMQEWVPAFIKHYPTGKTLDIVQRPDLREELGKLGLSPRTYNLLVRADCADIKGLAEMDDEELLRIRSLGEVSLRELKEKLRQCLPQIRRGREVEREEKKKSNKDPHFHAGRIGKLAEDYARRLRLKYFAQGEQPPTGAEILESAIKQHLGKFGFIRFTEGNFKNFAAYMLYTQDIGRISTRQGLSTEERINLYLHFLAHIALEHEDQTDSPDISGRFERKNRRALSKTSQNEEKEADKWIRLSTEAIVARTEQKDVRLVDSDVDSDEDWEPPKKSKPQPKGTVILSYYK